MVPFWGAPVLVAARVGVRPQAPAVPAPVPHHLRDRARQPLRSLHDHGRSAVAAGDGAVGAGSPTLQEPGGTAAPGGAVRAVPAGRGAVPRLRPRALPAPGPGRHRGRHCPGLGAAGLSPPRALAALLRGHRPGAAAGGPRPAPRRGSRRHRHRLVHPPGHLLVLQPLVAAPGHPALHLRLPRRRQRSGAGAGFETPPFPSWGGPGPAPTPYEVFGGPISPGGAGGAAVGAAAGGRAPVLWGRLPQARRGALAGGRGPAQAAPSFGGAPPGPPPRRIIWGGGRPQKAPSSPLGWGLGVWFPCGALQGGGVAPNGPPP